MKLEDLARRALPEPWRDGAKIPWQEPGFSRRMLREHLAQHHDAASRRAERIDAHTAWIDAELSSRPARILDLGCGPGLYTQRLARLGHRCVGIDISPASIAHARAEAAALGLDCRYEQRDLREGGFEGGQDLALLLFGELNAFRPEEAAGILAAVRAALAPGGQLILEPHHADAVEARGREPSQWTASAGGLFSESPHVVLRESAWHPGVGAAVTRWFVIDDAGGVSRHAETLKAYSDQEYDALLADAGFVEPRRVASLDGGRSVETGLFVLAARTPA